MKKRKSCYLWASILCLCTGHLLWLAPASCKACFSMVAGKGATVDGHVIVAHNEDDGPPQVVNHAKVPRQHHRPGAKVVLRNGGQLDQVEWTWAYVWSQLPGMPFSDSYVNEWGVCITSDNCPSREDRPELTDGGIGYMLRRLVAERAKTARDGVRLAGDLVERFGYIASGRTYIISDPHEGWLFCVVQGKHWLARGVPDDEVAIVANTYTIRQVDLSDQENILASRDIVTYAQARGWYDPGKDGPFDFAAAYASPQSAAHPSNLGRQWQGLEYLTSTPISFGPDMPFSLVPRHKVKVTDFMQILRHARRNASTQTVSLPDECPPEGNCRICSDNTQTSFVAQLRHSLPADLGIVYWMCLAPPETSVFIPYYLGMARFPMGFVTDAERPAKDLFDRRIHGEFRADPLGAFWTFSNYREKVLEMTDTARARSLTMAQGLEHRALRMQTALDETVSRVYAEDPALAAQRLANFSNGLYMEALDNMSRTLATEYDDDTILARARAVHQSALTLDSHVDIVRDYATPQLDPGTDHARLKCDLVKMTKGGMDGVFLAVYVGQRADLNAKGYKQARDAAAAKFDSIYRLTEQMYPDQCELARCADDIERIVGNGKKAIIIGMENGYPVGDNLDRLSYYYEQGARYITLCHSGHNQICDSSGPDQPLHRGLSAFGRQVVTRMNRLGMMCDASHMSEKSFFDLIQITQAPVLLSHSGCAAVNPHDRNVTDEQLRALKTNGGVIQIVALDSFLKAETFARKQLLEQVRTACGVPSREQRRKMSAQEIDAIRPKLTEYYTRVEEVTAENPMATIDYFVDHIDHAVQVAGIDHVGIGTDFDGGGGIPGFNDHGDAFNVTKELIRRGYSDEDIKKIWGGNLLRVWRRTEEVARELQQQ
ncbi:MAG: membrane dipeptidase [Phycisphaerae bacterium]|nr:membrane dipeptidase [Phycisphaerae bacterium]